jgi:hypothetical protein
MNETTQPSADLRFVAGLFTGALVGAGLAIWLAPRASEKYQHASTRVGEVIDDLTRKGQDVRDEITGAVARGAHDVAEGAHDVEHFATAARSRRVGKASGHSAVGTSPSKPQSV